MVDMNTIPQEAFWIIIAVIAAVAVIVVVSAWKKVRETQNNVALIEKQIELKKISLVEKDLESKRIMENVIQLPKEQQQTLADIREDTANLMQKIGFLHGEMNERVNRLEAKAEYGKLQKLLKDIEKKEIDIDKKTR